MTDLLTELTDRGLVFQSTDPDALREALQAGPVTFYCGFDPTASSLHVGSLVQLTLMRRLQLAGHKPLCIVGGATGLVGDPRPTAERTLNSPETVAEWTAKLRHQVSSFLSFEGPEAATVLNNLDWTSGVTTLEFLRDYGRYFRVNQMMKKDAVAARLESEQGISFTEFSYQILQGLDYLHLYREYGCTLQTGGQDQWGNMTAGSDLVHKVTGNSVHVCTTPLVTTADGTKFGKSEGNAIWLDPELTSPYAFYQFWINVEDASVLQYLDMFTDLTAKERGDLAVSHADRPGAREAHRALAESVTSLVHGKAACQAAQDASAALFGRGALASRDALAALDERTLSDALAPLPGATLTRDQLDVVTILTETGLADGRKAARRTITEGGASINNEKVTDTEALVAPEELLHGRFLVVRRGKKNLARVEISA